jgi:hypothetical protein
MKSSNELNRFGHLLVAAVLLAGAATAAYAQKNKSSSSPSSHSAPQQHSAPQHSAPQQHSAPPQQHSAPPQQHSAPQAGAGRSPSAPSQGSAPGRTFGNPSNGGRPGGNAPSNAGNTRPGGAAPNSVPNSRPGNTPGGNAGNTRPGAANTTNSGRNPGFPGNTGNARPGNTPGAANNGRPAPGGTPAGNRPGAAGANTRPGMNPPPGGRVFGGNNTAGRAPVVTRTPNGGMVRRAPDGRVSEVRTPSGAVIRHTPTGVRNVEVARPGGRVVVARSAGGYVQRPVVVRGTTYVQRTYIVGGRPFVRVYNPYRWGGLSINIYRPVRFYPVAYYTWAYTPWIRPIHWGWGWGIGTPWYGYYGGWFTPYPVYASPTLWLTDYLVATTLEAAYQERMAAQAQAAAAAANANANYAQTPLTADVKQAIADEVKRQLDQERTEQQNPGYQPTLFGGGSTHVFVVSTGLDVMSSGGGCALTEGDVLQLNGSPATGTESAQVVVMASKGNDCRKGSLVNVGVADLQEMQNQMRATVDQGLEVMRSKQGQGEMPKLPAQAAAPVQQAPYAAEMQPDPSASQEIQQVSREAERSEQDVVNQSLASGSAAAPANISLGQSTAEVIAVLGQPSRTADLGSKQIYFYKDMKVTFTDGRVTDVQ